ncbi:MAG: hypothetical protein WDM80_11540 [Limisphaerales bacterium]
MKDLKVIRQNPKTEEELIESLWWWRHCRLAAKPIQLMTNRNPNYQESRDWKDGMEQIAQEWELIRRGRPDLNWPPFYEVNGFIAENLRARLIGKRQLWARKMTTEISPVGWTDPDEEGYLWNLGCTKDRLRQQYAIRFLPKESEISSVFNGSLAVEDLLTNLTKRRREKSSIAKFLRWIDSQAKSKGIKLPRGLNGQRNRSFSWAWVEVLDISRYIAIDSNPLRKLSPAERKMKTIAMDAAKTLFPKYAKALVEIMAIPGFPWGHTPELATRERRLLLGQWAPKTNW